MKLYTIAFNNVKRNLSFYALYLFSVAFILTVFFSFVSFSLNEVMMAKISEDGRVGTMTRTIAVFLMAFVMFYMAYSNKFFMNRRMRELGIYALLGYRKSAMLKLLAIENIVICSWALGMGIVLGAVVHKGIIAGIVRLLDLSVDTSLIPLFNGRAIAYSAVFVLAVVLSLGFSNWRLLRRTSLLNLVRLEKSVEKMMTIRLLPAAFGLTLMGSGDLLLLNGGRRRDSIWVKVGAAPMGLLMIGLITLGTVLFIYSFLPYIIQKLEQRKELLYRDTEIVTIPKFIHRIRTNAKTLIVLSLLSAGTLGVFGATTLSIYYPLVAVERIIPSAVEFRVENADQAAAALKVLDAAVGTGHFKAHETAVIKASSLSRDLPMEYSISEDKGREPGFELIALADYTALLEQQGKKSGLKALNGNEAILVKYRPDSANRELGKTYQLSLGADQTLDLKVTDTTLMNPIGFANSVGTLIVSDQVYHQLGAVKLPVTRVMSIDGPGMRDSKKVYDALLPLLKDNDYFASAYARSYDITYSNSSTFLLLGFLTVLFFIASGSILYFHNISSVAYDRSEYEILSKLGYSRKKIKRIIHRQILILYTIPFALGLIHSVCGLVCYQSLLIDDVMGQSSLLLLPVLLALAVSGLVYGVYYFITRRSCDRIALQF
ncbi:ABC transporter permease [Paenibacillus sp. 22594]|uniref:ABC transporter permease n=1 Tax=Paenibacillus sp. 22594 TaxID=3453947 RepID=UPI003F8730E7